ncbi:hypothetical protein N665_1279s0010 [Sinapis alba]|nr:hypothetical protein N665_1279s0010 [Sinapis alba]
MFRRGAPKLHDILENVLLGTLFVWEWCSFFFSLLPFGLVSFHLSKANFFLDGYRFLRDILMASAVFMWWLKLTGIEIQSREEGFRFEYTLVSPSLFYTIAL